MRNEECPHPSSLIPDPSSLPLLRFKVYLPRFVLLKLHPLVVKGYFCNKYAPLICVCFHIGVGAAIIPTKLQHKTL